MDRRARREASDRSIRNGRAAAGEHSPADTESRDASVPARAGETSSVQSPRISPKARRLAKELGVDIATLRGSGPSGEILATDVQSAASGTPSASAPSTKVANLEVPSTLGRLMAERTTRSWTTVPHFFVTREVEASALNEYRDKIVDQIERTHGIRITHTDLLVALTSRALLKHSRLNASWTTEGIRLHDHVNMGVAIAVNDGVVAAVIPNAHSATIEAIATRRRDVAERARAGKLHPSDIADATFTISNLGMYQVDQFSAIITPPQAAILAVGSIVERVVAIEGQPAVRPMMMLTLSCDHRVIDGARAAMFLNDLVDALREPEKCLGDQIPPSAYDR